MLALGLGERQWWIRWNGNSGVVWRGGARSMLCRSSSHIPSRQTRKESENGQVLSGQAYHESGRTWMLGGEKVVYSGKRPAKLSRRLVDEGGLYYPGRLGVT